MDLYSNCRSWLLIDSTSDHLPCVLNIQGIKHKLKDPIKIESRDLKHIERLKTAIADHDWQYPKSENAIVNTACEKFCADLIGLVKHLTPNRVKTIPYGKLRKEAWLTPGILKSIRKEKQLYKTTIKNDRLPVETRLQVETK